MKYKVGITGGIGSGKTYISRIFESMGYPVFNADLASKELLAKSPEIIIRIIDLLGPESYFADGSINKAFIAKKIFSDQDLLLQMNAIMHPAVRLAFESFYEEQNAQIVFHEAAILFETGSYTNFDKNILIVAPEEVRIARIQEREDISVAQIKDRMSKQFSDEQKMPLADYIIRNGEGDMLLPQINEILKSLLST